MRKYGLVKKPMSISLESMEDSTLYQGMDNILDLKQTMNDESNIKNMDKLSVVMENINQIKDILNDNLSNPTLRPSSFKAIKLCLESFNKHYNLCINTEKFNVVNYGGLYSKVDATKIALESLDGLEEAITGSYEATVDYKSELLLLDSLSTIRDELKLKNNNLQVSVNDFFNSNSKEELIGLELPNSSTLQHLVNDKDVVDGKLQALSIFNNLQSFKAGISSSAHKDLVLEMKNHLNNLVNEFDIFKLNLDSIMNKFLIGDKYVNSSARTEHCDRESIINNSVMEIVKTLSYDEKYYYYYNNFKTKVTNDVILVSVNKEDSNNLLTLATSILDNTIIDDLKEIIDLYIKISGFIAETTNRYKSLRREPKVNLNIIDDQVRSFIRILVEILSFENMVMLAVSGYVGHSLKFIQDK